MPIRKKPAPKWDPKDPHAFKTFKKYFRPTAEIEKEEKPFRGVYIAPSVCQLKGLTWIDKVVLSYVISFWRKDLKFFVANDHLQSNFNISRSKVSTVFRKLHKAGYIQEPVYKGKSRTIYGTEKLLKLYADMLEIQARSTFF